jgi:hypothetical protein
VFNSVELGGVLPWEHREVYLARSPVTYARDITTPLLIIHAEDDLRCPIEQAEQLFVALTMLGREGASSGSPTRTTSSRARGGRATGWSGSATSSTGSPSTWAQALHKGPSASLAPAVARSTYGEYASRAAGGRRLASGPF